MFINLLTPLWFQACYLHNLLTSTMNVILIVATITLITFSTHSAKANIPCTTPNNETASCISLFSCPILIKSVGSSNPSTIDFVKKSLCGDCGGQDINVCCGKSGTFSTAPNQTNATEESHRDFVLRKLLPTRTYCGLQHTDDRFYNKTETALDEFPWLVEVKWYRVEHDSDFTERCNGFLISNQYVLTDQLCGFHARSVKLGQHDISETVSCIEDPVYPECTEGVIAIDVEEKFLWRVVGTGNYGFILLRLKRKISYTDYIRPICLPLDESIRSQNHQSFVFSGWGAATSKGLAKKRLTLNVTNSETCYKDDPSLEGNIKSARVDLICLAHPKGNTTTACNGDHGGPLMFSHRHQWFAQGVFIKQSDQILCSDEIPVKGIAITPDIIEWILDSMH